MKTTFCKHCGKQHDLKYQRQINGSLHLIYVCPKLNRMAWLPYVPNLGLEVIESRKLRRERTQPGLGLDL